MTESTAVLEPVSLVQRFFACALAGDIVGILQILSPDVRIQVPPSLPYGGEFRGHRGALQLFSSFRAAWSETPAQDMTFFSNGACVMAKFQMCARAAGSGALVTMPVVEVFEIVDGKVASLQAYYFDSAFLQKALSAAPAPLQQVQSA